MPRLLLSTFITGLLLTMLVANSSALTREKILYQFAGGNGGDNPEYGLVFDSQGNAYGTTYYGGTYGWGTIFRLEKSKHGWIQHLLYSFQGNSDGSYPLGNLLIDAAGNLYGTTRSGGTGTCQGYSYCGGTVFELTRSNGNWKHAILYNFCSLGGCSDGEAPSGLTFDNAGNIYGTTAGGGEGCEEGCGTVYKLSLSNGSWKETVLHAFDDDGDGYYPASGVTIDKSGNLYGTTSSGAGYGYGMVYVLNHAKHGWKETMLYAFDGSTNNKDPNGNLTLDSAGNIFGVTTGGSEGCEYQCGMIYRLSRSRGQWVETSVFTFDGSNGASPNGGLILNNAGKFYGSTIVGGAYDFGELFELQPGKTWTIKLLYSFTGDGDDASPNPGVTVGPDGGLYGTTPSGSYNSQFFGEIFDVLP